LIVNAAMQPLRVVLLLALALASAAFAASMPYNDAADARADVREAQAAAKAAGLRVLIVFGANWCEDCRALDAAMKSPRNAALIGREFVVVKVDVGNFDRNLDLVAVYGNPIARGIPAAVVVSADNRVQYATRAGELADARRMSETGVYEFFRAAAARAASKK
jgi:thioredoxin